MTVVTPASDPYSRAMTTPSRTLAAALGLAALALTAGCAGETPVGGSTPAASAPATAPASSPAATSSASAPGSADPGSSASATPNDATASPGASASPSASPSASASASASPSGTATGSPLLTAAETALVAVPGGRISSLESERGGQAWEVHVLTEDGEERQLRVSGDGSEVTSDTAENSDDDDRTENQVLFGAEVDHVAASEAVLAEVPDGVISELTLDEDDDDALTWEAGVQSGAERRDVTVDAASGEVLDNDLDD